MLAVCLGRVDFTAVKDAQAFALAPITMAKFDVSTIYHHAHRPRDHDGARRQHRRRRGDHRQKLYQQPRALHRTLLGDGLATSLAGLFGGPANTTYGENTGVLALAAYYDPRVMELPAVFAVALSFIPKFGELIPTPSPTPSSAASALSFTA